ncbi:hypothetical protein CU666_20015 [Pseudomonas syringae pv. actinidifoliorum]|nr:hypothetical protein [Pseudomonas syringae pv. actinidifoliorum]
MPFWTLRVLLTTQSVATCITTLERAERDINYRAIQDLGVTPSAGSGRYQWRKACACLYR